MSLASLLGGWTNDRSRSPPDARGGVACAVTLSLSATRCFDWAFKRCHAALAAGAVLAGSR